MTRRSCTCGRAWHCEDLPSPPTVRVVHHPRISGHVFASWVLWCLGYPDQALVHSQEALTQAQRLANPYMLMWCQSLVANLYVLRGEAAMARQLAEASLALATTLEAPFWGARSTFMRGIALTRQGCIAEGLEQMHRGWAAIETTRRTTQSGLFPGSPCRSSATCRTTGRCAYCAGRGAGVHTHLWGALVGSGMPSSLGRVLPRPARAHTRGRRGSGTFAARARYRPTPTSQVPRTACRNELESSAPAAGKAPGSPASYWRRSMAASPRALTPPTSRRPKHCWKRWRDNPAAPYPADMSGLV